ncbi:MAG: hypothetical protein KDI55_22550 [Anaerolineae bacterium]|nr:hypothetical protein [Anaerolineae bacterium]MCB0256510.1 hypothetical protein [Anaerolineae bacterium]
MRYGKLTENGRTPRESAASGNNACRNLDDEHSLIGHSSLPPKGSCDYSPELLRCQKDKRAFVVFPHSTKDEPEIQYLSARFCEFAGYDILRTPARLRLVEKALRLPYQQTASKPIHFEQSSERRTFYGCFSCDRFP